MLCDHSYDRRCHTSYTTTYSAQQEEECDENYKKSCFIEYSKTAVQAEVQICVEPLIKDCDAPGPEVCRYAVYRYTGLQVCGIQVCSFAGMRGPMNANKAAIVLRLSNLL